MNSQTAVCAVGLVCVFALAATVYAADVQLGTWKINLAKSKYDPPNLAPKSTLVKNDGAIKATVDTHRQDDPL
jgi:hypothetical protein